MKTQIHLQICKAKRSGNEYNFLFNTVHLNFTGNSIYTMDSKYWVWFLRLNHKYVKESWMEDGDFTFLDPSCELINRFRYGYDLQALLYRYEEDLDLKEIEGNEDEDSQSDV